MKVTGNVKYIPAGTTQYIIDGNDGEINIDTSVSAITIILPNIINSGYANTDKGFIINDISGNAGTNNIIIVASNNTVNSQSSVSISANGGTAKCSIASMSEWFIITEPSTNGMSGNLTTNYIPKAIGSSALDNSVIYQNGLNIGINTNQAATKLMISANDQTALFTSVRYESLVNSPAGIASLKARGTDVSPLAIIAGDEISTIAAIGYYGSGFGTTGDANFIFFAEENFTLTNRGTSCKIGTTPLGTSSVVYNFGISSEGNVSIGMPSLNPTARLQVVGFDSTPSNYAIKSDNSASAPLLYVRNDASVGIGTSLINAKLSFGNYFISTLTPTSSEQTSHIKLYESGSIYYGFGVSTDYLNIAANQSSGNIGFYTNGIKKIHINSNGKLNINNSANPNQNTAELAITGSSSSSSNYGIYLENLGFNPIFNVRNDGNVGIGTNAATTKLQVVGLPTYANNAAAISASLTAGAFYIRTGHGLDVVV